MSIRMLVALCAATLAAATAAAQPRPLSLAEATAAALARNPDLRIAALALATAGAALDTAGARPNPAITLQTAGINPNLGVGSGPLRAKTVDTTLRIDQLIERGGKRELRIDNAAGLERAARGDVLDARRTLRQAVSAAYYDLLAAADRLAIARQGEQVSQDIVNAAEKRRKAGDLAGADVARARIDAARARNDADQAESDAFAARQALLLLIGDRSDYGAADAPYPSDPWPQAAPPVIPVHDAALEERPDVRAARARLEAAMAASRLALAARRVDVSVGIQAEHYPASISNPQGSGNSFGISLQVPLLLHNRFDGEIRAAALAVDTARESLARTAATAHAESVLANEHARTAFERMRRYDQELLPMAEQAAGQAEFAFAHGAMGIMDLLDVRRTLHGVQIEAVGARADYAKSLAPLAASVLEEDKL